MRYITVLFAILTTAAFAGDYYIDAQNGSDATGDGSEGNPWQTIQHAFDNVSAYDGDGADTLSLSGVFQTESAIAQSDDDNISIITVSEYLSCYTLDVSNTENAFISIVCDWGWTTLELGEASTVSDCVYDMSSPGRLGIRADNKNDISVIDNFYLTGDFGVSISGGSGHTINNNSSIKFSITADDVVSTRICTNG